MTLAGPVVQLDPGEIVDSLSGITNTQMPELIGTLEFDAYQDFSIVGAQGFGGIDPLYSATLLTRMVRSNQTGMLTMNFQIQDSSPDLIGSISHIEITGFEGVVTRVEYRNELTGPNLLGPDSAARSEDGSMISFGFGNGLGSSDSSKFFFAMLDVADYDFDGLNPTATIYLTSGESVSLDINPPVPAPGALALLGMGGLAISRRRR
jgi:hypothetical protein